MFLFQLCVCVSVRVSVRGVSFEADGIDTFFLAQLYMSTISRSSLSTRVTGPRSRSKEEGGWPFTERHSCYNLFLTFSDTDFLKQKYKGTYFLLLCILDKL